MYNSSTLLSIVVGLLLAYITFRAPDSTSLVLAVQPVLPARITDLLPKMAQSELTSQFITALDTRRSIYTLSPTAPVPESSIRALAEKALLTTPSAFNTQTSRIVLAFNDESSSFWKECQPHMAAAMGEKGGERALGFAKGLGTAFFFVDENAVKAAKDGQPAVAGLFDEWATQSDGMHQLVMWAGLAGMGVSGNLQHYHFIPQVEELVYKKLSTPQGWKVKAQLVFGANEGATPAPKDKLPLNETFKVLGQK